MFRTRAGDAGIESLAALKNLSIVKLDYTAVDDKGLAALQSLPRMRELSLDSTDITDAGVPLLKSMDGLKDLNLYHTLVTEAGMKRVEERLARLRYRFRPRFGASEPKEQVMMGRHCASPPLSLWRFLAAAPPRLFPSGRSSRNGVDLPALGHYARRVQHRLDR